MESCLYEGDVHHERLRPVSHRFQYRLFMAYLDLAEASRLIGSGVLSGARFGAASFLRQDHLGNRGEGLDHSVRALVAGATGSTPGGPIRLLTHLRSYGYYFSPLNLYYCHGEAGTLDAVVAEVQNTPWLERHTYVLWQGNRDGPDALCFRHAKSFHVSPFMGMNMEYRWRLSAPADDLRVAITNEDAAGTLFRAAMNLRRLPLTASGLRAAQRRHPLMCARISAAIYAQAFQLWRKRCPLYAHPRRRRQSPPPRTENPASWSVSAVTD